MQMKLSYNGFACASVLVLACVAVAATDKTHPALLEEGATTQATTAAAATSKASELAHWVRVHLPPMPHFGHFRVFLKGQRLSPFNGFPHHPPKKMAGKLPVVPAAAQGPSDIARSCKFSVGGEAFDLSPLTLKDGDMEYAAQDPHHNVYKFNVCGTSTMSGSDCQRSGGMICQYGSSTMMKLQRIVSRWGAAPFGTWSFIDSNDKKAGVKLSFENGDDCDIRGHKAPPKAAIYFTCDASASQPGPPMVQEVSTCNYVITMATKHACLGAAGSSWGWHFITWVIVLSVLYFGIGWLYNNRKHGLHGVEALPHREFWADLPALVQDGLAYTGDFCRAYVGKKSPHDDDL